MARPSLVAGRALLEKPGRLEKKGANIARPRDQEPRTTNRYHENEGVSTRVRELVFGGVVCFA